MPQDSDTTVDAYQQKFGDLRAKLIETLGTDTVDLLLERAVKEVQPIYPGFTVHRDDVGSLLLDWHDDPVAEHSDDFVRLAFSALYAALLIILARLLGKEIALRLASALDADLVMQGQQIARA